MLSNRDVVNKVRGAFLPFRCVPQIYRYDQKLRFRVLKHDGTSYAISGILLQKIREEHMLDKLLQEARLKVEAA